MAKKTITIVEMTDDIDGTKADRTVAFTWDGKSYEIDLSKKNANAFEKALAPYLQVARPASAKSRGPARRGRSTGAAKHDLQAVREWARANGHEVSERGRIASSIIDAYRAANA
ncbi:MAG: histone-like nucleoid-structuring protein Lsr2 [Jatrophihabitans sp.]|uniref:histone-like nucleoid-structuring protein Lsr2 n=1 Tax=Jatrophihabitans sp. TaxID=1932789 RepID=UPI003F814DE9